MRNKWQIISLVSLLLFAGAANSDGGMDYHQEAKNVAPDPHEKYPVVYTVNANYGLVTLQADNNYQLVLHHVYPYIIYHAEQPQQITGPVAISSFLKSWTNAKKIVEAHITGIQTGHEKMPAKHFYQMIKLSAPHYDVKTKEFAFTLYFPLDEGPTIPAKFNHVTLYINGCDLHACN